jgi:hypothetical protein
LITFGSKIVQEVELLPDFEGTLEVFGLSKVRTGAIFAVSRFPHVHSIVLWASDIRPV